MEDGNLNTSIKRAEKLLQTCSCGYVGRQYEKVRIAGVVTLLGLPLVVGYGVAAGAKWRAEGNKTQKGLAATSGEAGGLGCRRMRPVRVGVHNV